MRSCRESAPNSLRTRHASSQTRSSPLFQWCCGEVDSMPDRPPKKLRLSVSGMTEADLIRQVQELTGEVNVSMTFQAGSNVSFYFQMPGANMKEQSATHSTKTVGNVSDSTVGAIGAGGDINVFINSVESSHLPEDAKAALKNARQVLETLALNPRSKKDVSEYLEKMADEGQQPEPDPRRLKHLLSGIKDMAAPVASALSIAASLAKLLGP